MGDRLQRDSRAGLADVRLDAHACQIVIATAQHRWRAHGDACLFVFKENFDRRIFIGMVLTVWLPYLLGHRMLDIHPVVRI